MSTSLRNMMLLVNVAGLLSVSVGSEPPVRYACPGNSVQVFQNIDFNPCNADVSLNINGDRNIRIANWLYRNCSLNATYAQDYDGRVFLYPNGTIMIHDLHHFDQGHYIVVSYWDRLPQVQGTELIVMAAPRTDCKPTISRIGNTLVATLNVDICGKPFSTPYWMGYNNTSETDKISLQIDPGNAAGKYVACVQGLSLQCERSINHIDHCSTYALETHNTRTPTTSSSASHSMDWYIVIIRMTVLMTLPLMIVILIFRRYRSKQKYLIANQCSTQGSHKRILTKKTNRKLKIRESLEQCEAV